jgi:pectinesterase
MDSIRLIRTTDAKAFTFPSIQAAVDSIPLHNTEPVQILLAPGVYREKLTIDRPFVTLEGQGRRPEDVVITYDDYANDRMDDGSKRGTFRSYSVFIDAAHVTLRNLTVENASGDSRVHGQAIALYAEGDRLLVDSCRLLGHQDTLFTGPLPPKELQPGGFIGPKQFAPRINGRQHYRNCYICGDVDFIFGSATAFFEHCTLESLRRSNPEAMPTETADNGSSQEPFIEGYVAAASTPNGQEYGYVFYECSFVSADCPPASVYLGRPWRDYARTVLIACTLGAHIHPAGFHDWNKLQAHDTAFYAEYQSRPETLPADAACHAALQSACTSDCCHPFPHRADFVYELDAVEAAHFTKDKVLEL